MFYYLLSGLGLGALGICLTKVDWNKQYLKWNLLIEYLRPAPVCMSSGPVIRHIEDSNVIFVSYQSGGKDKYLFVPFSRQVSTDSLGCTIEAELEADSVLMKGRSAHNNIIDITPPRGVKIFVSPEAIAAKTIRVRKADGSCVEYTGGEFVGWPPVRSEILE